MEQQDGELRIGSEEKSIDKKVKYVPEILPPTPKIYNPIS
jgi:hypothetical protein